MSKANDLEAFLRQDFAVLENLPLPWQKLRNKRILITGGTGNIGRYFTRALCWINRQKRLDMSLYLFRRSASSDMDGTVHWIEGNIADEFLPPDLAPDFIIHMASPASTRAFRADPVGLPEANILATRYLLERARVNHAVLIYFSSSVVYQSREGLIPENAPSMLVEPGRSLSLYAACKAAGELLCEKYRLEYQTDCRIVRPFNVNGPGEALDSDRCFPDFLRQLLRDGAIKVTGTGTPLRDCCDLLDFTSGLLYVLLMGESGIYNIGNEENACSTLELARMAASFDPKGEVVGPLCSAPDRSGDSLLPDTAKLRQLGWRPQIDLKACIRRCLESYAAEEREK